MRSLDRCLVVLLLLAGPLLAPGTASADWPADPLVNLPVCTATSLQQSPDLISDLASGAIVTWMDDRGTSRDIYAQRVLSAGTTDPAWPDNGLLVCNANNIQSFPVLAGDGAGGAIIAWQDLRSGVYDIYAQHVLVSGTVDPAWPANGRALCLASGNQTSPVGIADGAGGAIFAWRDQRFGNGDDVFAQHVLASGDVDAAWPVDGVDVCDVVGLQQMVRVASDGSGGAIVIWQDQRFGPAAADIYAMHVLAQGSVDSAWPFGGRIVCSAAGSQDSPVLVGDGNGGMIAAWTDPRAGSTIPDVYAQHVLADGTVDAAWPVNGLAVCALPGRQQSPALVGDGAHGAIVAWSDRRTSNFDIYVQHLLPAGTADPTWPVNGRALCTDDSSQAFASVVTDGNGGAVVAWTDFRVDGANPDIYAGHVWVNGTVDVRWPVDGVALSAAVGIQTNQKFVPDAAGGAIAVWTDIRHSGNIDIYAQRVQSDGSLGGGMVGVPIASLTSPSLAVRPNPWRGRALSVSGSFTPGSAATLEMIDVAGRLVASRRISVSGRGVFAVTLDAGRDLAAGLYFVRLREGRLVRVARVTRLR